MNPSIDDYLPGSEIDKIMSGDTEVPVVPIHADEWNGIGYQQRAALMQAFEDSLLLGVPFDAMCGALQHEAQCLRAELAYIRANGLDADITRASFH